MIPKISKIAELKENTSTVVIFDRIDQFPFSGFTGDEKKYATTKLEKNTNCILFKYPNLVYFYKVKEEKEKYIELEAARIAGSKLFEALKEEKIEAVQIADFSKAVLALPFIEGLLLSAYSFDKYKKEKDDFLLKSIEIAGSTISDSQIEELVNVIRAVFYARNLVNEPLSFLTANQFSKEIEKMGEEADFCVEVFHKQKIEALKMGGLLAVNKGSIDPPTFTILEWKPENAGNVKPVVLVGKGVVFDTGGLSLKPTPKSMDFMKSDMAGAAAVAATIFALAKNKVAVHVIGLIPATDNRPDGNAYVPGDVITMFDGTTVEIKNTDAEGRLILADALSYAKKYSPVLVIDIATLTGAADIVAGKYASVVMGNSNANMINLKQSGEETFERLIEVPLWEEYSLPLKSTIADLNNLGIREAQSTIAGKFLEHFTDYDWIHLDTAGTPFLDEKDSYRPVGGTGFGVRLLFNFLKKFN
jgi:leucyl aminopeptidase